jgi:hypothetical protein
METLVLLFLVCMARQTVASKAFRSPCFKILIYIHWMGDRRVPRPLCTQGSSNAEKMHIQIYTNSPIGIKTHGLSVWPTEGSTRLTQRDYCGRHIIRNKKFWKELIAYYPWYYTDCIENDASNNSPIVACVFVAAVMFLLSRCLATIGGIHIQTHKLMRGIYEVSRWDGPRCHDIHTKFHKDWFRHSKVFSGWFTDTQTTWWSHKPKLKTKLRGFGPLANYADRATAASWRSSTNFCG